MKVIETEQFNINEPSAVTIGNFDGIHLGHQKLIQTVLDCSEKEGLKSVVFSFNPHPVEFFGRKDGFKTMFSVEEKKYVIGSLGVDILIQYPFNREFAGMSPEEFMNLLVEKTNCKILVVGENYCFGRDRVGNIDTLKELGKKRNIKVIGIPRVKIHDVRVSSTRIRGLINYGDMETVTKLLNKPYFSMGEIVHGDERGRMMNFPTINMLPQLKKLLPPDGVYFSRILLDGKVYSGMSNIGLNPTFNGEARKIETHIFDFNENVYGKTAIVGFYKRIRNERKFKDMKELMTQLNEDKAECIKYAKEGLLEEYRLTEVLMWKITVKF